MIEKYEFIDAEYAACAGDAACAPTVVQMCEWLEVSKSGYLRLEVAAAKRDRERRELLKIKIKALFEANNGEYGYRRMHAALLRGGEQCRPELVRRLMRELGLEPCQPKPWRHSLTEQDGRPGRSRTSSTAISPRKSPGEKMVGDITYIPTWEGWLYLATVIDCATRKIVGWAMDDNYKTPLITSAIEMAARNLDLPEGAVFHSDRGSNYTSGEFAEALKRLGIRQSVGRTGICYDNALAGMRQRDAESRAGSPHRLPDPRKGPEGHCAVDRASL